jgi:methylated-DNA-protein-cysteine methyltransferase-like protein
MDKFTFYNDVLQVVAQIPFGKVTSYGAIARYLGSGKSSRMVGYALHASLAHLENIPAHRVVNRNGLLTGKNNFEPGKMENLLINEGLIIENNQIKNFKTNFWDPNIALAL